MQTFYRPKRRRWRLDHSGADGSNHRRLCWSQNKHPNEPARIGFLLGTRQFSCSRAVIHTGETIDITARCLFFAEPELPSQFECTAAIDGELIAQSNLTVFQPKEFQPWIA